MTTRITAAQYKAMVTGKAKAVRKTPKAKPAAREPIACERDVPWRRLVLEIAPATKERHRTQAFLQEGADGKPVAKARSYTPGTTRRFEAAVKSMLYAALGPGHAPMRGPVALSLHFGIPRSWAQQRVTDKPDLDNIEKALKDACNRIVYDDDSQVTWVHKRKYLVDGNGWIIIGFGPDKSAPPSSELADLGYDPFNVDANRGP